MKNHKGHLFLVFTFAILLSTASCNQTAAIPTATIAPTATLAPTATAAPAIQPGDSERKLMVNDLERSYLLHIPPGLNSQQPVPVIFAFHGYSSTPYQMQTVTEFDNVADLANFLVVYPKGVEYSWNTGEKGPGSAIAQNVDEPAFIRQMLSDLDTIANIDPKRIYAVGWSQGGALVYRLACDMSDTFAAIASVSGPMEYSACQPPQAVSVIHVHGLADTTVPYSGGGSYDRSPVEQGIATWVQLDDCTGSAQVEKPTNIITHTAYASCQAGTAVELYTIDSGRHDWPYKHVWPASEIIWDFFEAHPKP